VSANSSDPPPTSDSSAKPDLSAPAKFTLASLLDLIDARVRVPASGGRPAIVLASPFTSGDGLRDMLPKLMDLATVTNAPVLRGKVNVNLATPAMCAVPGIDAALPNASYPPAHARANGMKSRDATPWL
jgi:hypothetical protein